MDNCLFCKIAEGQIPSKIVRGWDFAGQAVHGCRKTGS